MSRMSGYRSLGHSLGYGFHPEGSRFQFDHVFFPKTTKKPHSPKNMSRARRPPSRLEHHTTTRGDNGVYYLLSERVVPSPTREWVLGILGHLGRIGYLIPYLVVVPSDTGFTPRFVFIHPPKNQEHQETPFAQDHPLFIPSRARRPPSRLQSHTTTRGIMGYITS